jgi:REase_DpnII-MboI
VPSKRAAAPQPERTVLVVPLAQAKEKISVQLGEGNEILSAQVQSKAQLEELEHKASLWHDVTKQRLLNFFNTQQPAHEFDSAGILYIKQWSRDARSLDRAIEFFRNDVKSLIQHLESINVRLDDYPASTASIDLGPISTTISIEQIARRFHLVARQLRQRHQDRATLDINDEYDVQDLFHALLKLFFDDVRREEWTPSYAGGHARMDFLLKAEQVVIETKKTRPGLQAKELGTELLEDIGRYQSHPDCRSLICFICDPDGRVTNPDGLERDLSRSVNQMKVTVVIAPKGQ